MDKYGVYWDEWTQSEIGYKNLLCITTDYLNSPDYAQDRSRGFDPRWVFYPPLAEIAADTPTWIHWAVSGGHNRGNVLEFLDERGL